MKESVIVFSFIFVLCLIFFCMFVGTGEDWAIFGWVITGIALVAGALIMSV